MTLDEALAVHRYLEHRPPGDRTWAENAAFKIAWDTICHFAKGAIEREAQSR